MGIKDLLKWIHLYKKEYTRTMDNTILSQAPYKWTYPIETKPFIFRKLRKGKSHFFSPELSKYYTDFTNEGKFHLYSTHRPLAATLRRGKMFSHVPKEELDFTLAENPPMSDVCVILEESMIIGPSVGPTMVLLPFVIALCNTYYNSELNIFNTTQLYSDQHINFETLPLVEGYLNFTNEFNVLLNRHNLSCSEQHRVKELHDNFISNLAYRVNAGNLSTEQTSVGLDLFIHKTLYCDLTPDSIALLVSECFSLVPM